MTHSTTKRLGALACIALLGVSLFIVLQVSLGAKLDADEKVNPTSENQEDVDSLECLDDPDQGLHCVKIDITDEFQKDPSTVVSTTEGNALTITLIITVPTWDETVDLILWDKNQNKKLASLWVFVIGGDGGACEDHLECASIITYTNSISITQLNETFDNGNTTVEITFLTKTKKPADTDTQVYSAWLCPIGAEPDDKCLPEPGWVITERSLLILPKPIDVKIRAFIPCGAVEGLGNLFGGDNRSFAYTGGQSRFVEHYS